jgi:hypothetical protein
VLHNLFCFMLAGCRDQHDDVLGIHESHSHGKRV